MPCRTLIELAPNLSKIEVDVKFVLEEIKNEFYRERICEQQKSSPFCINTDNAIRNLEITEMMSGIPDSINDHKLNKIINNFNSLLFRKFIIV